MITHSSDQGVRDNFDTGPLSWVMGEIREALTRSKTSVREAVSKDNEAQSTALRHAKAYLHQAHGALQIVDIDGVALITQTSEDVLGRLESAKLALTDAVAEAIESAYQAVIEYLEDLLSGAPHQPVRLFPYLKALIEVLGDRKAYPSDLFFPNLSIRPQLPISERPSHPLNYPALRQRFEKALLPFLKSTDQAIELANSAAMGEIIGEVEKAQTDQNARGFWWVMRGFAEAVSLEKIKNEIYVKQLFARINLELRKLGEGSTTATERLLRDALFFIAAVEEPSPRLQQIRVAYQLQGQVPADYEKKRYGQIDAQTLITAKERLSQAKAMWNRIAGGDASAVAGFEQEMSGLADAGSKLNSPPLGKLLRELNGIARHAAHSQPGDNLGVEMATGLLFVENALNNINRLSEDFGEQAGMMTSRLLSIVAGKKPSNAGVWLDEMSREAQQRQTMTVLAGEMRSSLGQVEKMLDEYFSNPAKPTILEPIDGILHQIEGALSILDQDDAIQAIRHTRQAVKHFADASPEAKPDTQQFQQVAQNVGALSFFIETLQHQSNGAKKRFSFNEKMGVFQANLLESGADADAVIEVAVEALPPDTTEVNKASVAGSALTDLPITEAQSSDLHFSATEPDAALPVFTMEAAPAFPDEVTQFPDLTLADPVAVHTEEGADSPSAATEIPENEIEDLSAFLEERLSEALPVAEQIELPTNPPVPATDEAIDAELLEIFLSEAEEVLNCVRQTLPKLRNEAHNQEHMTTLRRSFHTLKGSGRMVGLMSFGDAAWSIEQVLNLRLSEGKGGSPELYALLEYAGDSLGAWVADLQASGSSDRGPAAIIRAAERVKKDEPFYLDEDDAPSEEDANVSLAEVAGAELTSPSAGNDEAAQTAEPEGVPTLPQVEEIQLSDADFDAFRIEAPELIAQPLVAEQLAEQDPDAIEFVATVSAEPETASPEPVPLAQVIDFPDIHAVEQKHNDNIKRIGNLEISVPLHNIYLAETDELVRLLSHDLAEWRHEPERNVNILTVHAAHSLAGSSATVGFDSLQQVAHALEMVLQSLARNPVRLVPGEYDILERSISCLKMMLQKFALCEMPAHEPQQVRALKDLQKSILARIQNPASEVHSSVPAFSEVAADNELPQGGMPTSPVTAYSASNDAIQPSLPDAANLAALAISEESLFERDAPADRILVPKDDLDADLLPVFLEEGSDMLPQIGELLRTWHHDPKDSNSTQSLLRLLHTIKGSARMAGAMRMGQHMHEMESRIEQITRFGTPAADEIEELLSTLDYGLYLFDQLLNPDSSKPAPAAGDVKGIDVQKLDADTVEGKTAQPEPVLLPQVIPVSESRNLSFPAPSAETPAQHVQAASAAAVSAPLVRVRADILDRLVNQAGEVSISRSRVETELDTLKQSLSELTENVTRLRTQLREIEIQAESQMASQMAHAIDREFDPLEFDRFTRLQELTRMMAESVNDVASVQHNLVRTIDGATVGLTTQARLTRDLQQDLMRVRMVQFASISERLYRVTRQAAKEMDKRVNLDIRGSSVEIDRGVLERMTGPFEHLLRNAIVHGIESREARIAAGKSEVGELLVEIRQEGNEVVIQFSDDGQGLNLSRIREKAKETGLLTDDVTMSDAELKDLIFHPGFSTAQEVTELAGRGVGMDVVRSEAAALGGRVAVISEPGKGAHFLVQLPLTLAVTQVVVLSTGGKSYAVPSVLVEQIQQLKANSLAAAYNDGAVMWQSNRVPLYYLSTLLGDTAAAPLAQQYSPVAILKSGNDRVAIHIDEVVGNREVVVKNIGPQLARMIGIAGATIMGTGDIVLIIDPVPLAQRALQEGMRAPRLLPSDAPNDMGAVAEMMSSMPMEPKSQPVQGLRTQHIVMVVDDSLTVRRVTQRFLTREGYQVVLAKDGVDALEQLQAITPDVMLVDIEMPRMDGFDLTRNIRNDERTSHIPIIMITSRTATKHRNYAMELGVNEYLGKPYQESDLLKLISGFVNKEPAKT